MAGQTSTLSVWYSGHFGCFVIEQISRAGAVTVVCRPLFDYRALHALAGHFTNWLYLETISASGGNSFLALLPLDHIGQLGCYPIVCQVFPSRYGAKTANSIMYNE